MRWLFYHLFLSSDTRLGRVRGLLLLNLRMVGALFVVASPFFWWLDWEYERHGRRAIPVIVDRWEVQVARDTGDSIDRYVAIEYADLHGLRHRHTVRNDQMPGDFRWEQVGVGDLLPAVEYLSYAPERFRFVGGLCWWGHLFMGGGVLAVAALIRWSAIWAPAGPSCVGGSE